MRTKYFLLSLEMSIIANEKIDSLLVIPTFICDFLCIHPFNDGNGRMSRLLTLLFCFGSNKKLTEEGLGIRKGSGRNTFYVRADSK